jgi:hypothetical protein
MQFFDKAKVYYQKKLGFVVKKIKVIVTMGCDKKLRALENPNRGLFMHGSLLLKHLG